MSPPCSTRSTANSTRPHPDIWYDGPVGLLDELYVIPAYRGAGIGSALLNGAESVTRDRGGELLEINVEGADADARRFYERHGYRNRERGQQQPSLYYWRVLELLSTT